jgi:hypothetical protein
MMVGKRPLQPIVPVFAFRLRQTGVMPINRKRAALRFRLCGLQTGVKFQLPFI